MKNFSRLVLQFLLIITSVLVFQVYTASGQVPPPPPPPNGGNNGHGLGGNQGQENAPIGSGLELLLLFGAVYSGKKVNAVMKKKDQ